MLTCVARSKHPSDSSLDRPDGVDPSGMPRNKHPSFKSLTYQIKDMALKASGTYRNCNPCTGGTTQHGQKSYVEWNSASERFRWSHRRTASSNSLSSTASRHWGKEMEERLKGISSGEGTPASASWRRVDPVVFVEEHEPKEWVAQVDSGVLITFVSMPRGGNDLKRIRFSREKFNKWQAQKWWTENYDRVMELYNVKRLNRQAFPLPPTPPPPRSEAESLKIEPAEETPVTKEHHPVQYRYNYDSTPEISSISGAKTETSSVDASITTSSSREADCSGEISVSNASDLQAEWVEEDEPGVYITIRSLPGQKRELRRVRFSRAKFGEIHARLWWEENRARVHKQYL